MEMSLVLVFGVLFGQIRGLGVTTCWIYIAWRLMRADRRISRDDTYDQ